MSDRSIRSSSSVSRFAKWVYSIGVLRVVPQKYISLPLINMKLVMIITNIYLL